MAIPWPPSAVTSSAVPWIVPGSCPCPSPSRTVRPVTCTVAPASPSPSAMPLPTPRLAPVTTATFPAKLAMAPPFQRTAYVGRVGGDRTAIGSRRSISHYTQKEILVAGRGAPLLKHRCTDSTDDTDDSPGRRELDEAA